MNPLERALTESRIPTLDELKSGVREYQRKISTLEEQTISDGLTGLYNRAFFDRYLEQQLKESLRYHQEDPESGRNFPMSLGVIYADLNDFKQLNDTLGHHEGDLVLKATGKRLQQTLRGSDVAARLGGDEFGIILPAISSADAIKHVRDKVHYSLTEPIPLEEKGIYHPSISIGGVLWSISADEQRENKVMTTGEEILKMADQAMYIVKKNEYFNQFFFLFYHGEQPQACFDFHPEYDDRRNLSDRMSRLQE